MARENPRWGYDRIQSELCKLGIDLDPTTVANIMNRHGIPPAPQRGRSTWRTFLNHYREQILACDFFTIETIWLKTLYVLSFIDLGTRRVYFAGCTANPDNTWVTQQARQLTWTLREVLTKAVSHRFLIHDRDQKFTRSFDTVFAAEKMKTIRTPYRAPRANAADTARHWKDHWAGGSTPSKSAGWPRLRPLSRGRLRLFSRPDQVFPPYRRLASLRRPAREVQPEQPARVAQRGVDFVGFQVGAKLPCPRAVQ